MVAFVPRKANLSSVWLRIGGTAVKELVFFDY